MKPLYQPYFLALLVQLSPTALADTHVKVQAALDWQVPLNQCKKPKRMISHPRVVAAGGTYFQAPSNSQKQGPGTTTISDVDHYQVKRFERKKAAWEVCVKRYKSAMLEQFNTLIDSAQHSLTEAQAHIILTKLAQVQAVIVSPEGVTPGD